MKLYLTLLLCLSGRLFAQTTVDSTNRSAFTTEIVKFNNAGVTLKGVIFKPIHIYAAVVLVHGSGKDTSSDNMASLLASKGIAVFTYDKRGVGKSGGLYVGPEVGTNNVDAANLNLLASDAGAATETLIAHLPAHHGPVGLMGFSQAGWVIPIAAKMNSKVNFMVLFSGPVVTTLKQLRYQFYTEGKPDFWKSHTEAEAEQHIVSDPDRYHFADTDPRTALAALSIPGLWLFGGKDVQIPARLSIENLNALKAQGKPFDHKLFPELGHNTGLSKSLEPFNFAVQWMKSIDGKVKQN